MIKKILSTTLFALVLFSSIAVNAVQHDFNLPNNKGGEIWADLNRALDALATQNSGPNDPANPQVLSPVFTGTGVDDATSSGTFSASSKSILGLEIDANGTPDTFRWRKNSGAWTTGVTITGSAQTIADGITVTFATTTGHTVGDKWFVIGLPGYTKPFQYWADTTTGILKQRSAGNSAWVSIRDLGSTTPPLITLLGSSPVELNQDTSYTDAGATALDNVDGDLTASIVTSGLPIDTATPGNYTVTYNVTDSDSNAATPVTRAVNVIAVCTPGSTTFNHTGANQTFVVPGGCSSMTVKAWGAGGGGNAGTSGSSGGANGGGGGYVTAVVPVTGGDSLTVIVGGGGQGGNGNTILPPASGGFGGGGDGGNSTVTGPWNGGAGGGRSAVLNGTTDLVVAGGGGGSNSNGGGGAGGGLVGITGGDYYGWGNGGTGGTQSAGGTGDAHGGTGDGQNGSKDQGGSGTTATPGASDAGGGGGGGYYGGGAGYGGPSSHSAGGGGSSYAISTATSVTHTAGSARIPGNSAESGTLGYGGVAGSNPGNYGTHGKVIINWSN